MTSKLDKYILSNGMVILGEPMDDVASAAFTFMLPCGASVLPTGCSGSANVIIDWLFRGAGKMSSRELIDALDSLGIHRSTSINSGHISFGAALEASNLLEAIKLYADIILKPALDNEQFELSRQLAMQELASLDDDPRQKVMLTLYDHFYPKPLGTSTLGNEDDLKSLTAKQTKNIIEENFTLSQTIFAVAGKYNFESVCGEIEKLFANTISGPEKEIHIGKKGKSHFHEHHDGAQVHIGLMTETTAINSKDYYDLRIAVSVLSGGMSSRLFTEVREKRGLCYAVGAKYNTLKSHAGISCYTGTTPDKAQQTTDVIISEFDRLSEGITEDELQRAKIGLESSLVMQSESSIARASGIAGDYYLLGRVRPIEEIKTKLEQISVRSVLTALERNPFSNYTVVTVGPETVKI